VKAWYYWYLSPEGTKVRLSCGEFKKPCISKKDAEAKIAELEAIEDAKEAKKIEATYVRLRDVAGSMYKDGDKHMKLRMERGDTITDVTRDESRAYLDNWIIPNGGSDPSEIDGAEVEDWLIDIDRSNSWRNRVLEILGEVSGSVCDIES